MPKPALLDVVALLDGRPEQGLARGQVGTIIEELDDAKVRSTSATMRPKLELSGASR
jgi:hypothetical protein